MSINDKIKKARLIKGLTQEQLALMVGVAKSTIAGYEKGIREPNMQTLSKIIDSLNVDANFLFNDGYSEIKSSEASTLSSSENQLLSNYRQLNPEGQQKVYEYAEDLVHLGRYKKCDFVGVDQKEE